WVGVFGDQVGAAVGHEGVDEVVGDPAYGAFGGGHVDSGEAVDDGCAQSGVYGAVGVQRVGAPGEGGPGQVHAPFGDRAPAAGVSGEHVWALQDAEAFLIAEQQPRADTGFQLHRHHRAVLFTQLVPQLVMSEGGHGLVQLDDLCGAERGGVVVVEVVVGHGVGGVRGAR